MSKQTNMEERIFRATETLMAEKGIQGLSMQKIAQEAGISAGTIYLYFENKEDLLMQLAQHIFDMFHDLLQKDFHPNKPLFHQYCIMWQNLWAFLLENPEILVNFNQYKALPNWCELKKNAQVNQMNAWCVFCQQGIKTGELVDLPANVLWNLSLASAVRQASDCVLYQAPFDEKMQQQLIECSFRAISNH